MKVDSHNIEFGYELISCIPYAYYLHSKGKLTGTRSGNDSDPLYYFSPKHEINTEERKFENISKVKAPNTWIHKPYLDKKQFKVPNYKKRFANTQFKFKKETVVICNRVNIEWNYKIINFFDIPTLRALFDLLKDKYQIVYINVEGRKELYDGVIPQPIGDFELLREYPEVINFHDIVFDSWNEAQLKVFANCSKFITMNGGHSILASYFGGENIVMSKPGKIQSRELNKGINSFYTFYHEFSGSRTVLVNDETELIKRVKLQWIKKEPIVNILVRTSNRPEYFNKCMESISEQTYKNINVFVSKDNEEDNYTIDHKCYPIRVKKEKIKNIVKENYGIAFPANLYLNELQKHVKSGLVIYLDDDDEFKNNNSISSIVNQYKKGNDLIFWRVDINNRVVPSKANWEKAPVCGDISGIGFAFDYKHAVEWEGYKLGDYRVSTELYNKIDNKTYINRILTKSQGEGNGYGLRLDKNKEMEYKILFVNAAKGSKYKNGDEVEMRADMAVQFVRHGYAVFVEDEKKAEKNPISNKAEKKIIDNKKPAPKKRGRPKKVK